MKYLKVGIGDNDFWKQYMNVSKLILSEYADYNDGVIIEDTLPELKKLITDYVYAAVCIRYLVQERKEYPVNKRYFEPDLKIVDRVPSENWGGEYYYVPLTYDESAEVIMR